LDSVIAYLKASPVDHGIAGKALICTCVRITQDKTSRFHTKLRAGSLIKIILHGKHTAIHHQMPINIQIIAGDGVSLWDQLRGRALMDQGPAD